MKRRPHRTLKAPADRQVKDTDSKHVDAIHCVLVVVPVDSLVAAQQRLGLAARMLSGDGKKQAGDQR